MNALHENHIGTGFTCERSIVREIWGKSDTILFIFAGAAAEFALNKSVDWLYFTGKLPSDPIGRLFSTVNYARKIVFSDRQTAHGAIDSIAKIHAAVENARGARIPEWAYRDVLFMLVDYSIRSYELLERKLSNAEKQEVFDVFHRVGSRMNIDGLPQNFDQWTRMRKSHLAENTERSFLTTDLFRQYRKHLGPLRYSILIESQKMVVPAQVSSLLGFRRFRTLSPLIPIYRLLVKMHLDKVVKTVLLPARYKDQINSLDLKQARCPFSKLRKHSNNFQEIKPYEY